MRSRLLFMSYVALTVLAFATLGRAPRIPTLRAQDLPALATAIVTDPHA